jgi:hypothetical protein
VPVSFHDAMASSFMRVVMLTWLLEMWMIFII